MRRHLSLKGMLILGLGLLILASGCGGPAGGGSAPAAGGSAPAIGGGARPGDAPAPEGAPTAPEGSAARTDGLDLTAPEAARVARAVPEFGGMYVDGATLHIYLSDPLALPAAREAIADAYGADVLAGRTVQVLRPQYTLVQLAEWYRQLHEVMWQGGGVGAAGIDERHNRIFVGVRTREARERVLESMGRLGIPPAAVALDDPEGLLSEEEPLAGCVVAERPPADSGDGAVSLALEPAVVRPGQELALTITGADPAGITRGVDSYLECWDGSQWTPRFALFALLGDRDGTGYTIYGPNLAINSLGLGGPGPEPVRVPDSLQPGWYRIRKAVIIQEGDRNVTHTVTALIQVQE